MVTHLVMFCKLSLFFFCGYSFLPSLCETNTIYYVHLKILFILMNCLRKYFCAVLWQLIFSLLFFINYYLIYLGLGIWKVLSHYILIKVYILLLPCLFSLWYTVFFYTIKFSDRTWFFFFYRIFFFWKAREIIWILNIFIKMENFSHEANICLEEY